MNTDIKSRNVETNIISPESAEIIRAQCGVHAAWLKSTSKNSYKPEEVPTGCESPGNSNLSALEVYDFCRDRPESYFLYIKDNSKIFPHQYAYEATTWTGDHLGVVFMGREFGDNFGGKRVPITVHAINGKRYHGTYFKSAGDYARVKMCKEKPETGILYNVEYTDTFSGEANYSWVKRATIRATDKLGKGSQASIMRKAKAAMGLTGAKGVTSNMGEGLEFRPYGSCTVLFVSPEY